MFRKFTSFSSLVWVIGALALQAENSSTRKDITLDSLRVLDSTSVVSNSYNDVEEQNQVDCQSEKKSTPDLHQKHVPKTNQNALPADITNQVGNFLSSDGEVDGEIDTDDFESDAIAIRFRQEDSEQTDSSSEEEDEIYNKKHSKRKACKKKKSSRSSKSKAKRLQALVEANKKEIAQKQIELEALKSHNEQQRSALRDSLLERENKPHSSELGPNTKNVVLCGSTVVLGVIVGSSLGILTPWQSTATGTVPFIVCPESIVIDQSSTRFDCSIIEGNLLVDPSFEGHLGVHTLFPNLVEVTGNFLVENVDGLISLTFEHGREPLVIGDSIEVNDNSGLEYVSISAVGYINDVIYFQRNSVLREINVSSLQRTGCFRFESNPALINIELPVLQETVGCLSSVGLSNRGNRALESFRLPCIQRFGGDVLVGNNAALRIVEFPVLQISQRRLWVNGNLVHQLDLSSLTTVGEDFIIGSNVLEHIDLPALRVTSDVQVNNCQNLKRIRLTAWQTSFNVEIRGNNALETFEAPLLTQTQTGNILLENNIALIDVNLNSLNTIGSNIALNNNQALPTFNLPSLTSIGTQLTITNNDVLEKIGLPLLEYVGGTLSLVDNPLLTTVNMMRMEIIGIFEISSCPMLQEICLVDEENCIIPQEVGDAVENGVTTVCHEVSIEGEVTYRNDEHYDEECQVYDRTCDCL